MPNIWKGPAAGCDARRKIRALEEEARHARQAQVGKLADEAGLLLWSDADLAEHLRRRGLAGGLSQSSSSTGGAAV